MVFSTFWLTEFSSAICLKIGDVYNVIHTETDSKEDLL